MRVNDMYSLLVVEDLAGVQDWYVRHLGFSVAASTPWFAYLTSPGPRPFGLMFMRDRLEFQLEQFRTPYSGDSLIITLDVDDVDAVQEDVRSSGLDPVVSLRDEPWGQRHFMLRDPAGCWVDVVQQIEPSPGFFDSETEAQFAALAADGSAER